MVRAATTGWQFSKMLVGENDWPSCWKKLLTNPGLIVSVFLTLIFVWFRRTRCCFNYPYIMAPDSAGIVVVVVATFWSDQTRVPRSPLSSTKSRLRLRNRSNLNARFRHRSCLRKRPDRPLDSWRGGLCRPKTHKAGSAHPSYRDARPFASRPARRRRVSPAPACRCYNGRARSSQLGPPTSGSPTR